MTFKQDVERLVISILTKWGVPHKNPCTGICTIDPCFNTGGGTETLTTLDSVTLLPGNVLQVTYIGEDGIPQVKTASLASLADTETITTIINTIVGHKIGSYNNEAGASVDINESITTISGNIYTNEAGTPVDIIQTVEATLDTNGDLIVTVNGVDSTPLDIPTIPTWKKEILDIIADNTIPNLGFLPVTDSVILVYDGYTLCENLHYTISGQSVTFNPANLGKDILVGELVHVQYQTII